MDALNPERGPTANEQRWKINADGTYVKICPFRETRIFFVSKKHTFPSLFAKYPQRNKFYFVCWNSLLFRVKVRKEDMDEQQQHRKACALAESAAQNKRSFDEIAGPYWMLQLRPEFLSLHSNMAQAQDVLEKLQNSFSWLNFMANRNMGTKGMVSFSVEDGDRKRRVGCFCVLKTPRKLKDVLDKVGDACTAEKMQSGIRFSPSSTHPEYMRLASLGALVVEQEGVFSENLVPLLGAPVHPLPEEQQNVNAAAANKKYCRRNGQRSVACQVCTEHVFLILSKILPSWLGVVEL